jgi:hypothetical protein
VGLKNIFINDLILTRLYYSLTNFSVKNSRYFIIFWFKRPLLDFQPFNLRVKVFNSVDKGFRDYAFNGDWYKSVVGPTDFRALPEE